MGTECPTSASHDPIDRTPETVAAEHEPAGSITFHSEVAEGTGDTDPRPDAASTATTADGTTTTRSGPGSWSWSTAAAASRGRTDDGAATTATTAAADQSAGWSSPAMAGWKSSAQLTTAGLTHASNVSRSRIPGGGHDEQRWCDGG